MKSNSQRAAPLFTRRPERMMPAPGASACGVVAAKAGACLRARVAECGVRARTRTPCQTYRGPSSRKQQRRGQLENHTQGHVLRERLCVHGFACASERRGQRVVDWGVGVVCVCVCAERECGSAVEQKGWVHKAFSWEERSKRKKEKEEDVAVRGNKVFFFASRVCVAKKRVRLSSSSTTQTQEATKRRSCRRSCR